MRVEEIVIPDPEQCEDHRNVAFKLGRAKVFVHLVRTREQLLEILEAYIAGNRQADRRPQ
ncbi:hypothetical protein D3C86_2227510 [compost metagenome]